MLKLSHRVCLTLALNGSTMSSFQSAADLQKSSITKAINTQNELRIREQIKKDKYNTSFINYVIRKLGQNIEKYPTEKDKWYYDVMIDTNTLKWEISRLDCQTEYLWRNRLKYLNISEVKEKLDTLGYELKEKENNEIVNIFCCIPYYMKIMHRIVIKE